MTEKYIKIDKDTIELEIIKLKAEVFDLIAERDRIHNEINKRMAAISTKAQQV